MRDLCHLEEGVVERKRSPYRCSKLIVTGLLLIVFAVDSTVGVSVKREEKLADVTIQNDDTVLKINAFNITVNKKGTTVTVHHPDGSELSATDTSKYMRDILLLLGKFMIQAQDFKDGSDVAKANQDYLNTLGGKEILLNRIVITFDGKHLTAKVLRDDGMELAITDASNHRLHLFVNNIINVALIAVDGFGMESEEIKIASDVILRWKPDNATVVEFDRMLRHKF